MTALLVSALLAILVLLILFGVAWYWLVIGALILLLGGLMVYVSSIDLWRP